LVTGAWKKAVVTRVPADPNEFSLFDLANAHLLVRAHATISVPALVDLLLDEAVCDAGQGEDEDAATYALLAARLITLLKIELVGQPA
jgi:hypothetical protein